MSVAEELKGLDTYLAERNGVAYRLILAVGLAYFERDKFFNDPLTSNLGFLTEFIIRLGPEKTKEGTPLRTIIIAFDPLFLDKMTFEKGGKTYTTTRLQYDLDSVNEAIYKQFEYHIMNIPGPDSKYPQYPRKSLAFYLPYGNVLLCINKELKTEYPERRLPLYSPFKSEALKCVPSQGSDYDLLLQFCQKHNFEEIGVYNCAFMDERNYTRGSVRKNKYFENMCELLYIAYTCGKHSFLLDTTMGSVEHANTRKVVNRRKNRNHVYHTTNDYIPFASQTSFLTVSTLNDTTMFKEGYKLGTYEGGKKTRKRKGRSLRNKAKH